jgi:acid phosphatase (class A)
MEGTMGSGWMDVLGSGWFEPQWGDPGGAGASSPTFAMRFDTPMVADTITMSPSPTVFPPHSWDGDLYAMTILPDFLGATYNTVPWEKYIIDQIGDPPPVAPANTVAQSGDDSIDDLRILAVTQRPEALNEILNQNKRLQLCFLQLMMMTQTSHPRTYFVLKIASRVGEVAMMRLKRYFNRPRPSQYCPTLYPPVPVPGHASYPAGHAILAHLIARCLIEITADSSGQSPYQEALLRLADDIGINRVYAGLHFKSDISAGKKTGELLHDILQSLPATPVNPDNPNNLPSPATITYATAITAAKAEWP